MRHIRVKTYHNFTLDSRPFAIAFDGKVIHWYPVIGSDIMGDVVHESQHYLASKHGMGHTDWDKFAKVAIRALRDGNYQKEQVLDAKYMLTYGGHELHAELPWIVKGDIPSCLAPWYPWFHFEGQ